MPRTWGQIRQVLRQRFAALPLELLTSAIQTAYNTILDAQDWSQLTATGNLRTVPRIDTTGSVTLGSSTVTGTGFLAEWVGRFIQFGASTETRYQISEFVAGSLILERPYEGATTAGVAITIYQSIYALPLDCKAVQSFPTLAQSWTRQDLAENSTVNELGEPFAWVPVDGTADGRKQVELYPAPTTGTSYVFRYLKSVTGFSGYNTQDYPLNWVSDDAILANATAICCAEPSVGGDYTFHLAQFNQFLDRMKVQDANRSPQKIRLDPRLTRHDRERQSR
jgi:hypothetical protein